MVMTSTWSSSRKPPLPYTSTLRQSLDSLYNSIVTGILSLFYINCIVNMATIAPTKTVVYKTANKLQISLDIYLPSNGAQKIPIFLWFHGGGLLQGMYVHKLNSTKPIHSSVSDSHKPCMHAIAIHYPLNIHDLRPPQPTPSMAPQSSNQILHLRGLRRLPFRSTDRHSLCSRRRHG